MRKGGSERAAGGGGGRSDRTMQLGEARGGGAEAVTAMAFHSAGGLLLVGHASGNVALWEWRRTAWESAKIVKGAMPGRCNRLLS